MADMGKRLSPEEAEADFRRSLEDVALVIERLGTYCQTPDEMLSMVRLAIDNTGQLRLLIREVTAQKK